MTAEVFLDSNVLLYSCSAAPDDAGKRKVAENLILNLPFAISAQVLHEFIANALRNPRLGIMESNIEAMLRMAAMVRVQPVTHELVVSAMVIRRRFQLSQGDATIIAAAAELGGPTVYSEDMNDGQDYGGVRVVNPFK